MSAPSKFPPSSAAAAHPSTSDAYQVDVVVALFAVLLILLLTSIAAIQTEPDRESKSEYRPQDDDAVPFQLRSMAPTYPYRSIWIAKDQLLTRLDLRAVAERYAGAGEREYAEKLGRAKLSVRPDGDELDSFRMDLELAGVGVPESLAAQQLPLTDVDAAVDAVTAAGSGAVIYVWHGQMALLQPVLSRLRADGVCHKLRIDPRKQTLAISRRYADFIAETVLRCY